MKPSIGRIVLVKVQGRVVPAIVVRVWSDICINVRVFFDGTNDVPEGTTEWYTSLILDTNEIEPSEYHWIWPPRV